MPVAGWHCLARTDKLVPLILQGMLLSPATLNGVSVKLAGTRILVPAVLLRVLLCPVICLVMFLSPVSVSVILAGTSVVIPDVLLMTILSPAIVNEDILIPAWLLLAKSFHLQCARVGILLLGWWTPETIAIGSFRFCGGSRGLGSCRGAGWGWTWGRGGSPRQGGKFVLVNLHDTHIQSNHMHAFHLPSQLALQSQRAEQQCPQLS